MTTLELIELWLWLKNDLKDVRYDTSRGGKYVARDQYDNEMSGNFEAEAIELLWRSLRA